MNIIICSSRLTGRFISPNLDFKMINEHISLCNTINTVNCIKRVFFFLVLKTGLFHLHGIHVLPDVSIVIDYS